jgi:hypothetical protein
MIIHQVSLLNNKHKLKEEMTELFKELKGSLSILIRISCVDKAVQNVISAW